MGNLTYYVGAEIIMFVPRFMMLGAPTYHVGAPDIMWHSKYLIFFNHIHIWQVSLQLSRDDTFQIWTYAIAEMCHDNTEKLEITEWR